MSTPDEKEDAIPALRRLVRDREAADDLVQDCLESAVARRHLWRSEGPILHWLYRIMVNRSRHTARRARLDVVPLDTVAEPMGRPGAGSLSKLRREHLPKTVRPMPDRLVIHVGATFIQ